MIGVTLKGLFGRKLRSFLTALAVVIGVAMVSGTYVLTDTFQKAFDDIFNESYAGTDAVVSGKQVLELLLERTRVHPGQPARGHPRAARGRGGRRRDLRHPVELELGEARRTTTARRSAATAGRRPSVSASTRASSASRP